MNNVRQVVELFVLDGWTDKQIFEFMSSRGYKLTQERITEMREEMDETSRSLGENY